MKLTILVDNQTYHPDCCAEWGLALFAESGDRKILFDTGASDMFAGNAKKVGVDLAEAEALIISHGHYDHTGGIEAFIQANQTAPIYVHKEAFDEFYGMTSEEIDDYNCGILWSDALKEMLKPRLRLTEQRVQIAEHMYLLSNIPANRRWAPAEQFFRKGKNSSKLEEDSMDHEQVLVIEEGEKLFLLSGCSHKGVIPILEHVKREFPDKKISALVAGMHLHALDEAGRKDIMDELKKFRLEYILPLHCTGRMATMDLKLCFPETCVLASTGQTLILE